MEELIVISHGDDEYTLDEQKYVIDDAGEYYLVDHNGLGTLWKKKDTHITTSMYACPYDYVVATTDIGNHVLAGSVLRGRIKEGAVISVLYPKGSGAEFPAVSGLWLEYFVPYKKYSLYMSGVKELSDKARALSIIDNAETNEATTRYIVSDSAEDVSILKRLFGYEIEQNVYLNDTSKISYKYLIEHASAEIMHKDHIYLVRGEDKEGIYASRVGGSREGDRIEEIAIIETSGYEFLRVLPIDGKSVDMQLLPVSVRKYLEETHILSFEDTSVALSKIYTTGALFHILSETIDIVSYYVFIPFTRLPCDQLYDLLTLEDEDTERILTSKQWKEAYLRQLINVALDTKDKALFDKTAKELKFLNGG